MYCVKTWNPCRLRSLNNMLVMTHGLDTYLSMQVKQPLGMAEQDQLFSSIRLERKRFELMCRD